MAGERVLYVCFDPALLVQRERLLITQGYDVTTVLGEDGVMAVRGIQDFDFVLIGDEGSLPERQNSTLWLKEEPFAPPVIALCRGIEHVEGADYEVSTSDPKAWVNTLADCIRRCQDLA